MAENIQSDIIINVDTSVGIAEIKQLQRQISSLNAQLMSSGAAQAKSAQNIQRNLLNNINATGDFAARVKTIASTTETFTTRLEKNKMGMGEYFRYAGASSKTFGKLFKNEFDTIEKVARERVKTLQTQYIKLGRDANGALKAISVRPLALDMENLATKTAMAAQKQQLMNQLLKQGSTNLLNFGKNTQWAGRQLMVGFSIPLAMLGTAAAKTFMQMEEQAIRFKRVYGEAFTSTEETNKMISQVKSLANEFTKYGVAVEKTMQMAADAAAMGKQGADLLAQVNQATRLAVLGGVEQEQALETTISLTNAFGVAADNLSGKIDFLNAVENQTVTSIEDLTIAVPKAGPVIQQLGGDVEDLAFFLTAMKEGGINASEGANALKSGLASLINPTKKAAEMLDGMGVNIKGIVEANKGDVKGTVIGFAKALDTLDPLNRARAIEQLFGKFQFARLSTLFQNVIAEGSQASRVLKLSNSTAAELAILSERELKRVQDSPMYKFQKVVEDVKVALVPLGEAFLKAVIPIGDFIKGFLDKFNSMGDGAKQFAVIATTVIAGIGPILLMTFGLIANGAANLIKMFLSIGKVFQGAGRSSQTLGSQTEYMTQQQLEAASVAASLNQTHANLTQTFSSETRAVNSLATAYARAVVAQAKLSGIPLSTVSTKSAGPKSKKFASGVVSVPGPKGAGDIVPAMLSPGESVIPADMTQKYAPLISGMVNGTVPGFKAGVFNFAGKQFSVASQAGVNSLNEAVRILLSNNVPQGRIVERLEYLQQKSIDNGKPFLNAKSLSRHFGFKPGGEKETNRGSGKSAAPEKVRLMGQPAQLEFEEERKFLKKQLQQLGITLSDGQIKNALQMQASHILPDRNADGSKNWTNLKNIIPDLGYVNGYINDLSAPGNKFAKSLLETAAKNPKLLKSQGIDVDILTKILAGKHPTSRAEIATLRAISQQHMKFLGAGDKNLYRPLMVDQGLGFRQKHGYYNLPTPTYAERIESRQFRGKKSAETRAAVAAAKTEKKLAAKPQQQKRAVQKQTTSQPKLDNRQQVSLRKLMRLPIGRFADGVVSVPGPKGAGDVVPAMLSPGESVIPAKMSKKYAPLISGMVNGSIPGYSSGLDPFGDPNPFGGDPSIGAANDPFGPSNASFDVPEQKRFGSGIAAGFVDKVLPVGKRLAGNFAQELKQDGKKIGQRILSGAKDKLVDTGSRILSGTMKRQIEGANGRTFSGGVEVRTDKNGNDYYVQEGKGRISADEASAYENPALTKQELKQQKKEIRARRSGRIAQAGMGLSMAVGMATAVPGAVGEAASSAVGPISAATAAMSLIPGPWGLAAGVIAGAGVAAFQAYEKFQSFRSEVMKTADTMSAGAKAMKSLSEFAGVASPSEILAKMRQDESSPYNIQTGKNTFGGSYLQSEQGKSLVGSVQKTTTLNGRSVAASDVATQLAQAIQTNVLTKEQAASIAMNLGAELKDHDFSANVLAKITKLVGPGGEDITNKPLEVAARIIQEKQSSLGNEETAGSIKNTISDTSKTGFLGQGRGNATEVAAAEAKYSQGYQDILDMGQQNLDNLELEHRKQLEILTTAGDLKAIEKENIKYQGEKAVLQKTNAASIKKEYDYLSGLQFKGNTTTAASANQIMDNIEASKKLLFEGQDTAVKDAANKTIENVSNASNYLSVADRATLVASIKVENIDDYNKLQALFPLDSQKNGTIYKKIAQVSVQYGQGAQDQLTRLGGFFGQTEAGKERYEVFIDYVTNNADGQKVMDDLTQITRVTSELNGGKPIDISIFIDKKGNPTQKLKDIQSGIKKVSDAIKKNNGKAIKYSFETTGFKLTKAQADYFNSLPADQQKTYTTTYLTVQKTVDASAIKNWRKEQEVKGGTVANFAAGLTDAQVTDQIAAAAAYQDTVALTNQDVKPPVDTTDTSGGGKKEDPINALLNKLKMVRDASINAAGGIKELQRVLGKTGKSVQAFAGVEQNLVTRENVTSEFMDYYDSLEKKAKDSLVKIVGAGKSAVATLTPLGRQILATLREGSLGDYQNSLVVQKKNLENSAKAFNMLKNAGMSAADALEVSKDASLANAIITQANTGEVLDLVDAYKQLANAATAADKFQKTFNEASAAWNAKRNKLDIDFRINTKTLQQAVTDAENEIAKKTNEAGGLDDLQAGLTQIGWAEDEINKKYDLREEALDRISSINDKIIASQKGQLTIADALSRGDISAAASAIQDQRTQEAQNAIQSQRDLLGDARKAELGGLSTTVNGVKMTRKDIEAKILTIEKEIFDIEEKRLEPARESIRLKEVEKAVALKSIEDQELEWQKLENDIALAATAAWDYVAALKEAAALAAQAVLDAKNKTAPVPVPYVSPAGANANGFAYTSDPMLGGTAESQFGSGTPWAKAAAAYAAANPSSSSTTPWVKPGVSYASMGGMIPKYFSTGNLAKGTDTVPAMLTPGEFIMSKYAVENLGVDNMRAINNGASLGSTVYNSYDLNVNVRSDANPNEIARAVMTQIKQVDSQRIRGVRL